MVVVVEVGGSEALLPAVARDGGGGHGGGGGAAAGQPLPQEQLQVSYTYIDSCIDR